MRSRVGAFTAAVAIVAAFGWAGTAVAGGSNAETQVTIQAGGEIFGYVTSDRNKCMKERKVALYVKEGSEFERYANDTTEKVGGEWRYSFGNPGLGGEKVHARARKTEGCKGARSPTVTVEIR